MATGDSTYASELPPKAPQRARDYTWLQSMALYVFQQLPTGHTTAVTEGPPKGPLRLRDYTHLDLLKQNLIGQDRIYGGPGQVPTYDWQIKVPPPAPMRLRDYTILASFSLPDLIGHTKAGHHTMTVGPMFTHTLTVGPMFVHTLSVERAFVHTLDIIESSAP